MTANEANVMRAWHGLSEEFGFLGFRAVEKRAGVPSPRRYVRSLARKGFLVYGKGLTTEDGFLAGAGYTPTDAGWKWLRENVTE